MGNRLIAGETTHFANGTKETRFATAIQTNDNENLTGSNGEVEMLDQDIAIRSHQFDVVEANDSVLRSNVSRIVSLFHGTVMDTRPNAMSLVDIVQHPDQIRHTGRVTKDSSVLLNKCSIYRSLYPASLVNSRPANT
jgi:hypothetical protein